MSEYTSEDFAKLLTPFPPSAIGQLPKGGALLDFVGHAHVRKRLTEVDPLWTWRPMALDAAGLPVLDADDNLWVWLTVCGVTKPGVGDGKSMKERISDALRNSAMSFGVAVDLWIKEMPTPDPIPKWKELGWASQADHDALRARVSQEGPTYGPRFKDWWKDQGYKWPISITAKSAIEAKLDEFAAAVVQDAFPEAEVVG